MAVALRGPHDGVGPAPAPQRGNVLLIATVLVVGAGVMLFGGLLGGYFAARDVAADAGSAWVPDGVTLPNVALLVTYATLLMSSVTAEWAVTAIRGGDRRQLYLAVGLTLLLGLAFLNGMSFAWSELGLVAGDGGFADHVYAVTVTHALTVVAAVVLFVVLGFRALGGQFSPRNTEFVRAATTFWHFTVAAGAVTWFAIWFLEGGP